VTELKTQSLKTLESKAKMSKMSCSYCSGFVPVFSLSIPRKSTQKEVVNAVKAESVVANVAAVNPSKNMTEGIKVRVMAISGKSKSVLGFRLPNP
jgi:hypothetical protein